MTKYLLLERLPCCRKYKYIIIFTLILSSLLCSHVVMHFVWEYVLLNLGKYGFQWTERYGTVIECSDKKLLLTRMRYRFGDDKYVPVLRIRGNRRAYQLWQYRHLGLNPTLFCDNNTLYIIGTVATKPRPVYGAIHMAELSLSDIHHSKLISLPIPRCGEPLLNYQNCEFDSKFSVVTWNSVWMLFIRANMCYHGGCRHVQVTTSNDQGLTWSGFTVLQIDNITIHKNVNIYFFEVKNDGERLKARFPAVFFDIGGVYETTSTNGFNWSSPVLVQSTPSVGQRTELHPVGMDYMMKINLHMHIHEVEMLSSSDMTHNCDFFTETFR